MSHHPTSFFLLLIFAASGALAQNKPGPEATANPGKKTYMEYCSSCHGMDARGTGPAGQALRTQPADLTTLAVRHGGQFPYEYVSDVLRFGKKFSSHGSSDMPIWGPIFSSMEGFDQAKVKKRIKELCDYLASLQQKES